MGALKNSKIGHFLSIMWKSLVLGQLAGMTVGDIYINMVEYIYPQPVDDILAIPAGVQMVV